MRILALLKSFLKHFICCESCIVNTEFSFRTIFSSAILILFHASILGQGSIKGNIKDSATKQPLQLATISVYGALDTSLVSYRLSTPDGNFKVPNIPIQFNCRVIISYSGYEVYRKEFILSKDQSTLDLGNILLSQSATSLDDVLLFSERPPIVVRKDTIEFNVASFKTLPSTLLEDLLKKLPGVDVEKDGSIYVNGKPVNRILVDGKSFFGNDLKMATRNLPANIIDKVQVSDDKEEIDRNITGDLTSFGKVINLKLKRGVKKGLFGKVYAGVGNKDRYEAGGIGNMFRDTLQLSVLGFSNNINRSGFSMKEVQDLGGFNRSGYQSLNSGKRGGNQGFNLNGVSFGGLESGIANNKGAGFNLNHAPSQKYTFYLQYLVGLTTNNIDEINNSQQFIVDTSINTRVTSSNKRRFITHNIGIGTTLKSNPFTDIIAKAAYMRNTLENNFLNQTVSSSSIYGLLNKAAGFQISEANNFNYSHSFSLSKRYKTKAGRSLIVSHSLNWKKSRSDATNESLNYYYYPNVDTLLFQLYRNQLSPALTINAAATITEPLSKKITLRWTNSFDHIKESQNIVSYDKDPVSNKYTLIIDEQSNYLKRHQNRFSSTPSFAIKIKKITLTLGLSNLFQQVVLDYSDKTIHKKQFRYDPLPVVFLVKDQFSARLNQEVVQPLFSYLQTIPDQANLIYIRKGNLDLLPSKRTNIGANYFKYFVKTRTTFSFGLNGTKTSNDIALARYVNQQGVQEIVPVNIRHSHFAGTNLAYSKEIKKINKFTFTLSTVTFINFERKDAILNDRISIQTLWQFVPRITARINWKDIFEMRNEYSLNSENVTYSTDDFKNIRNTTRNFENEIVIRWPKRIIFESNLFYRHNKNIAAGLPANNLLWNVAANLLFLKGNKGQFRLSVYDILNRNNSYSRFINQNYITDIQTNILKRYSLLTFIYNFNNIGNPKKIGGKESLFLF